MLLARISKIVWIAIGILLTIAVFVFLTTNKAVDYNTQVKPILNKQCISCHGGVKREAGFSLLFRSEAVDTTESGKPAIIPGDPKNSEFIRRLTLDDPEERMPYKHPPLSKDEIELLTRWVNEGAKWGDHWAYVPVEKVKPASVGNGFLGIGKSKFIKNDIDRFILEKLRAENLTPSAEADKATLLRRASLDLIGMPVSDTLANWYLINQSTNAYEQLVDTLLTLPQYGERWASVWLDLARYADSKGYERDFHRNIWRYRDWLIQAFNQNKPYDEFIIEQIAGDLLPNPTDMQYIATAFHRNSMTNDEGGSDNEEFRVAAVIDRTNSTWEALMGTTFSCVQCHSHPYDPFKHDEYYKFMAFFNNSQDYDTYDEYPLLREFSNEDSIKFESLKSWLHSNAKDRTNDILNFLKTGSPTINSIEADSLINSALNDTKWLVFRQNAIARLPQVELTNHSQLLYRFASWQDGGKLNIHIDRPNSEPIVTVNAPNTNGAWQIATIDIPLTKGKHNVYLTYNNPQLKSVDANGLKFDWFSFGKPFPGKGQPDYDTSFALFKSLLYAKQAVYTPIMVENTADQFRPTHVFERGNWLVKADQVSADVPHSLNPMPANAPKNRLGLAKWMVDKKNPLVSRTIVNRIWEQFFGQGITETLEDFGTQGIAPTHRELLDYLSYRLMHDYNWDLQKLMKEIVLSATYRQDSKFTDESLEKDPFNKLYSRGSRVRLSAEQVRDQALFVSGLLNYKMLGPSVFPYQPEGIWMSPHNGEKWNISKDGDQYRRAIYTFIKRSAPYPSMITFDGTARETCTPRRIRTNTPMQALTTLNDSSFIETAIHFAYRMQNEAGKDFRAQIKKGYELAFHQPISNSKAQVLQKLYTEALDKFSSDKEKMLKMAGADSTRQTAETAALATVAGAMMNLEEFITKN
jgi:hypothetical protein